jgi:ferredoxin
MIFRVFGKEWLPRLFEILSASARVAGPVLLEEGTKGPIFGFRDIEEFSALRLGHTITRLPAKSYFLPHFEELASFSINGEGWEKQSSLNVTSPLVLMGVHPCDINALNKLDKVLLKSGYPMPHYAARRRNTFIVGHDCMPEPGCFCRSMSSDTVQHGFDMFLSDLGDRYFVEILTNTAYNFIGEMDSREPGEEDHHLFKERSDKRNRAFGPGVDTTDLNKVLDMEFQSDVWEHWGRRCFSCGACAAVCPTCYCHGVKESVSLDLKSARKTRELHSCNLVDFAMVAGGHNFRPEPHVRLKYRYYHKHRGFVEAFEEPLCVGCGRCGDSCLGGITVPEVISSVRTEEYHA